MSSLILIFSALLHALWNVLAKKSSAPQVELLGFLIAAAIISLVFIPFFNQVAFPNLASLYWGVGAGLFEGIYIVCLGLTLERSPIGSSYIIMRGGAMLLVWSLSTIFLGETVNLLIALGAAIVGIGLYLSSNASSKLNFKDRELKWPYLCALFICGYHLCYGQALEHKANPAALFSLAMWISLPILLLFNGRERFKRIVKILPERPGVFILGGLICTLSFLLFLIGLKSVPAGMALTLRNTSVIFAQIFAFFIGEKISFKQWVGAFFVAVGASVISQ